MGGAEPGQRPGRPSQPDPGADQGAGHGADRQPQWRGVRRRQPGQRAQPGGRRWQDQRRAVPRARAVWRAARNPASPTRWARSRSGRARASIRTRRAASRRAAAMCCCWAARCTTPARSAPRGRRSLPPATASSSGAAWAPARTPCRPRGATRSARLAANQDGGLVRNTGLIVAAEGDVTLAGRQVRQEGVALATTTTRTRGTIHLLNSASDAKGQHRAGAGIGHGGADR